MIRFTQETDSAFALMDQRYCIYHGKHEAFSLSETDSAGYVRIDTSAVGPCIHIPNMDAHKLAVFAEKKCADHLVFIFDESKQIWGLHIFELKHTIDSTKWTRLILHQFNGALLQARAIAGFLRIDRPLAVSFHCAYQKNKSDPSPAELKQLSGKPASLPWTEQSYCLPSFPEISLIPVHDCFFRLKADFSGIMPPLDIPSDIIIG